MGDACTNENAAKFKGFSICAFTLFLPACVTIKMMLGPAAPADSHIKAVCGYPPFADHGLLCLEEAVVFMVEQ